MERSGCGSCLPKALMVPLRVLRRPVVVLPLSTSGRVWSLTAISSQKTASLTTLLKM